MAEARTRWWPLAVQVAVVVASFLVYNASPPSVANVAIVPYAVALVFGPSFVYPLLGRRAAPRTAVLATLVVPLLWLAKEFWRVSGVFGSGETLYFALNPLSVGLFVGTVFQSAVWELALHRGRSGRWPVAVLGVVATLAFVFAVVAITSDPKVVFYGYISLYRHLFAAGG